MNKFQEAYNKLWSTLHNEPASEIEKHSAENKKCLEVLKELVHRTIPKKLDYEGDGYADGKLVYDTAICRSCGKNFEVDYDDHANYCPNCGQALDWSEIDD